MAPIWPRNFERKLWKDINSKISITKREITKTGSFIKNKEITVFKTVEKNQKSLLWKSEH